jgi:hypothetical protein
MQKIIITLVFEKNAIFRPKLAKIAENCDHNIDPWVVQLLEYLLTLVRTSLGRALQVPEPSFLSGLRDEAVYSTIDFSKGFQLH